MMQHMLHAQITFYAPVNSLLIPTYSAINSDNDDHNDAQTYVNEPINGQHNYAT